MSVYRGSERFVTEAPGRTTRHSFSFGAHYDPANVGFRSLVAFNDDAVAPGGGYPDHAHRDLEIVTVVLSGALTHRDLGVGSETVLGAGAAQSITAGSGIVHAELVDPGCEPTRFLQSWVRPSASGLVPRHDAALSDRGDDRDGAGWTPLASGERDALLPIVADATLWRSPSVGALSRRPRRPLPDAAASHLFMVGAGVLHTADGDLALADGDAVRLDEGADLTLVAGSQALLWTFDTPASAS